MFNLNELDKELKSLGIEFEKKEDAEQFRNIIIEEAEIRIGQRISEGLSEKELSLFEDLIDRESAGENCSEEIAKWLTDYCPNYKDIIVCVTEEIYDELKKYKDIIPYTKIKISYDSNLGYRSNDINTLKLSSKSYRVLKKSGINCIGDLEDLTLKDFLRINNMSSVCSTEIIKNLGEY